MAGLFDDLIPGAKPGAAAGGLFADLIPAKPKPAGLLRSVADLGIEAASGVARGVKATADAFGADNAVSRGADTVDKFAREYLSAAAKADDQRVSDIMAAAQDAGVWEQVKAAAEAFAVKPAGMIANALGTSVPTIATALIPGVGQAGVAARLGALGAMGAAQGAGAVKGSIYEAVKAEQIKAGASEAEAEAAAVRAQEYGGENTANIAGGAALGGAASATGVQPVIAKMLQRGAEPVAQAQRGMLYRALNPEGLVARTGMGALKEAPLEAAQGGQEQYASNIALQNEGFDTPAFRGVAGAAALEGLASAGPGSAFAALDKPGANKKPGVADVLGAKSVDEATSKALLAIAGPTKKADWELVDGALALPAPAVPPVQGMLRSLPSPDGPPVFMVDSQGNAGVQPAAARAEAVTRDAEAQIASEQQGAAQAAADQAIGVTPGLRRAQQQRQQRDAEGNLIPAGEATEVADPGVDVSEFDAVPAGEATEVPLIPTGEATELEAIPAGEASELDAETIQADDLLARDGEPFTSKTGAQAKAYASGGGKVVTIPDHFGSGVPGYVVRPLMPAQPSNTRGTDARDLPRSGGAPNQGTTTTGDANEAVKPESGGGVGEPISGPAAAPSAPASLTTGQRVTLDGKDWTVRASTASMVTLDDGAGTRRAVRAGSPAWNTITNASTATQAPNPEAAAPEGGAGAAPAAASAAEPGRAAGVEADGVDRAPLPSRNAASWVIRERGTGKVITEVMDWHKVEALNTAKYEAVTIRDHLASLNKTNAETPDQAGSGSAAPAPEVVPAMSEGTFKAWSKSVPRLGIVNGWTLFNDRIGARFVLMTSYDSVAFGSEREARSWAASNKANQRGHFVAQQATPVVERAAATSPVAEPETASQQEQRQAAKARRKAEAQPAAPVAQPEVVAPAAHQDPGERPEAATPAVVNQSLTTAAKAEGRKPSAMRAELLQKVDEAIAKAPDEALPVWTEPTKGRMRQAMVDLKLTNLDRAAQALRTAHDNRVAEAARRIGYVNFDVEGDGKFRVLNSRPHLEEFRRKVAASPGFKAQRPGPLEGPRDGGENGSGGKVAAFDNMVNEGDLEAASDYADAVGLELDPKKLANATKVLKWREERAAQPAPEPAPAPAPAAEAPAPAPAAEAAPKEAKPPAGIYADFAAFEKDTQPFGTLASMAAVMSGMKSRDWKTHNVSLGDILNALKPVVSRDWQLEKEQSDPAFAFAYRSAYSDSWRVAADIRELAEAEPKLDILNNIRGPWALDLINVVAGGNKSPNLANYVSDAKPYKKLRPAKPAQPEAAAPAPAEAPAPAQEATAILNAAGVTGKERLEALKDVKAGAVTTEELAAAYPAAAEAEAAPAPAEPTQPAAQPSAVDNFGEQLPPARRNMAAKLTEGLTDDDIASKPLSEVWPLAENDAIEDTFAAAVAHAARAEIPAKPRVAYKVKAWVKKVQMLRDLAGNIVSGTVTRDRMAEKINGQFASLRDWWSKVNLLEQVPRAEWKRIGTVEERPDSYRYGDNGEHVAVPMLRVDVDGKVQWLRGDTGVDGPERGTLAGNRAGIMALLVSEAPQQRMEFEVRQRRSGGTVYINKKGDSQYRPLMEFADVKAARTAITDQYDALVAAWEGIKARDNITERDLRSAENRPRAGKDHRQGRDVTPQEFQDQFGFRGGEFGKWVQQGKGDKERQAILNDAYDALMDLADLVGIPPKAISLNGTLGIAFGSRGSGWASAHFEPSNLVINLTKTRGAGALGHEWFHALDNYFARIRRGGEEAPFKGSQRNYRDDNYITHRPEPLMVHKTKPSTPITMGRLEAYHASSPKSAYYDPANWQPDPKHPAGVRPEVEARFAALVQALDKSPMSERAKTLDGIKESGDGYWSRTIERAARAFESYLQGKMQDQGYHNDFLANVVAVEDTGRNPDRYPYLLPSELKPITEAFDGLFAEVQTRTDDAGNVAMFSRGESVPLDQADATGREFWRKIDAGESFTDQEVLDAFATNRRGTRRQAHGVVVAPGGATTGESQVHWSGSLAGFDGYRTTAAWVDGTDFTVFVVPDALAAGADLADPAQARDRAIASYAFRTAPDGRYALSVNDVAAGSAAERAVQERGIGLPAGTTDKPYTRVEFGPRASHSLLQESVRRLALSIGQAPPVFYPARETGARAGQADTGRGYTADEVRQRFSRAGAPSAARRKDVETQVSAIAARWTNAPAVVVVDSMDDARVPEAVRRDDEAQRSQGATGVPEGFFHEGKVYLVAPQLATNADVARVLFHEALGHYGLRGTYGKELTAILDRVAELQAGKVRAKAEAYGLDFNRVSDRRMAAEEVLAEMAQSAPKLGLGARAIAAVRTWLRENVPGFKRMNLSDAEIVRSYILPARAFVERGAGMAGGKTSFSRGANILRGTEEDARAAGFTMKAYRGVSKANPFNDTGTTWLTTSREVAEAYAEEVMGYDDPGVLEVMVKPDSLPRHDASRLTDGQREELQADEFGNPQAVGIYDRSDDHPLGGSRGNVTVIHAPQRAVWVVDGGKAKGMQNGAVPADPGATVFSRTATQRDMQRKVRDTVNDMLGSAGAKMSVWDKTLATQYAKAERFPAFKRVFDRVQQYIEDVSTLANTAADLAPSILPKLETWKDLRKTGLSAEDATAVAGPIFTGTLTDEKVYSDAELRSKFNMNERQIGQYREFLAATNKSLDQVAAADVIRLLGDKNPALRELAVEDPGALRDGVLDFLDDQIARAGEDAAPDMVELREQIADKYQKIDGLKAKGYVPLLRFGRYAVNVKDPATGESLFFGLYENRREANKAARMLRDDTQFDGAIHSQGMLSEEQYKLMQAVPMESLEMFAEAIGAENSEVFQQYIKLAKNNRSALKRLIKRKGTAGFSQDVPRVLAAFVTSNSRMASGILNMGAAKDAAMDIRDGDVKDEAIKLVDAVQNPGDRAGWVRGLMFTNFIGGSIASAVVNLTQPLTMTLPYLAQFGGPTKAAARLMEAGKIAAGGKATGELAEALKRAERDGVVSPQEIHHLSKQAMGSFGNNPWLKRAAFIWGAPFSLAEQFNRRISFVAAYNTAKAQGIEDPFGFARRAVVETQGLYNTGNAPNLARGAIGASVMTFKQFSIHYLEWMSRMYRSGPEGKKAVAIALALLILAAGADGLPFADDMDDLVDTLAQALGYDLNSKKVRREFVANTLGLGDEVADIMARGLSAASGVPMDVSLRMSAGNLLPGTGILLRSNTDKAGQLLEVAGPAGGLAKQYLEASQAALRGDAGAALKAAVPVAVKNAINGADMYATGTAKDTLGRKVMDVDTTDALVKAIGFNPAPIARESEKIGMIRRSEQLAKNVEGEIAAKWAQAVAEQDAEGIADARAKLRQWNEDNPQSRIVITPQQIRQRVAKLKRSREQRFITTVSPERRQQVREAIQ